jgi:hypothetical protein
MAKKKITPKGTVVSAQTKKPIENLRIEVWDNNMLINESLGTAVTDASGKFEVVFAKRFAEIIYEKMLTLYFKVFRDEKLVEDTKDYIVWTPGLPEDIYIEVDVSVKPPIDDGGKKPIDEGGKPPIDDGGKPPIDDGGKPPIDEGGKKPIDEGGKKPPEDTENNLQPWVISLLKRK